METKEYTYATLEEGTPLTADVYYKSRSGDDGKTAQPIARLESLIYDFGFTVVVPDYRHCPTVSVFDGPVTDIHNCYSWTREELPALLSGDTGVLIDGSRVAVIGSSAGGTLALHLASASPPPKAIVSYFSAMNLKDEFWHSPMEVLSKVPSFPQGFLQEVMNEGVVTATPSSFKRVPGNPKPVPDFSRSRTAWLLSNLRGGTWLRNVVQDDNYKRVDPSELFSDKFPPTCFVHGSEDKMCLPRFSKEAHELLLSLNVDTELLIAEGEGHDFESAMPADHPNFSVVRQSHRFAAERV
ncbi:hypothetical protein LRP88_04331 [Fusarium phalaenopsidis]